MTNTLHSTELTQQLISLGAAANEPLARHTFVQVGGPADWFLSVRDREALVETVRAARRGCMPLTLLGAGSNVLIRDGGIRGLVIQDATRGCQQIDDALIEVDTGVRFASLARSTARAGLRGLEWAAGIPGSIGGGLATNAGAYGSELSDVLVLVHALTPDGEALELAAKQLELGYRDSALRSGALAGCIVTSLTLQLRRGNPSAALTEIERVERLRKTNAPSGPSLGSTFRNPSDDSRTAGQLIDTAGLKGASIGAAQVSTLHANYILNTNVRQARARDFLQLIELIQREVETHSGIRLEREIAIVGEEASDGSE